MSWRARDFCAEIAKAACAAGLTIGGSCVAAAPSAAETPGPSAASTPAAAAAATPLAVYGHLPTLEDVALSPDGKKVAYVRAVDDVRALMVHEFGRPQSIGGLRVGDTKLRDLEWMDDDNLLINVSDTEHGYVNFYRSGVESHKLSTYNVSRQALVPITFHVPGEQTADVAVGRWQVRVVDGVTTLFVPGMYSDHGLYPALFKLDVANNKMSLINKSGYGMTQWLIDESGRLAGKFHYHPDHKEWTLAVPRDDRMTVVSRGQADLDVPTAIGFSRTGDAIIAQFVNDGDPVWKPFMLTNLIWGPPLAESRSFHHAIVDHSSGRIIGGVPAAGDDRYFFFDNELQAHWDAVLRAFPGEQVRLLSSSEDFVRMLVQVFGVKDGYVYAIYDWYTHTATVFGKVYEGLQHVAEVQRVAYPAADGITVPGYLTLPRDRAASKLALIVLPHGGPASADVMGFDWRAQALAEQGYAVLQPNFRGSALNYPFEAAGFGEWGRKMQTDLSDGVRYLAAQGIVDPKRVCIVGASYGGYAALAGITLDPGVYRCAVSVAGISDLKRMFRWSSDPSRTSDNQTQRFWDRYMGLADSSDPKMKDISPIEHVAAVSVPVLLIHGRDDTVVPYEQSQVMADALKRAGKAVQFVTLDREDHWLSRSATRLQMLEATVGFLRANNPP